MLKRFFAASDSALYRHPATWAAAVAFLVVNFVLVAAPEGWWPADARRTCRAVLLSGCGAPEGWPGTEQLFIVTGEDGRLRIVQTESGTFEDWELPLASRLARIVSAGLTSSVDIVRAWSPLWVWHERKIWLFDIASGPEQEGGAGPKGANAAMSRAFAEHLRKEGVSESLTQELLRSGRAACVRIAWLGVMNELLVLAAAWLVLQAPWVWKGWRKRRRERLLQRGVCPACGYEFGGSARCPECGAVYRPGAQVG